MSSLLRRNLLLLVFCAVSPAVQADAQTQARLDSVKDAIAKAHEKDPSDSVFQYNIGLTSPNKAIEATGLVKDVNTDDLLEASIEDIDKRLKDNLGKAEKQQKVVDTVSRNHERNLEMEKTLNQDRVKTFKDLDALETESLKLKGKKLKQVKRQINSTNRAIEESVADGRALQERRAKLGLAKETAQLNKLQQEIAHNQDRLQQLERAKARKSSFDKGGLLIGTVLTAFSAEAEENALAAKEGRRPLAINKIGNFVKGISGYSTVMSVVDNVEAAKVQSVIDSVEFYERNGIDMTDPGILKNIEASAQRAVVRAALIEGGKLAPVIGDLMTIKEATDAAFEAAAAIEESELIQTGNAEAQFQNSLRTAVKIDAAVGRMEAIAAQAKLLINGLTELRAALDLMEQDIVSVDQQALAALKVIAEYNEMASAMNDPAVVATLEPTNLGTLQSGLKRIQGSADEQSARILRIKSEYAAGKQQPRALASNTKSIGDTLDRLTAEYRAMQKPLGGIKALSQGAAADGQVAKAVELSNKIKPVLQQQVTTYVKLRDAYQAQGASLGRLATRFQELRGEMPRYLKHMQTSKNLEEVHRDKIRAALDRANRTDIDQTALRKVQEEARNLPTSNEIMRSLAALENLPRPQDIKPFGPQVEKARAAWGQLAPLDKAAGDSLQKALKLLKELESLAAEARPVMEPAPQKKPTPPPEDVRQQKATPTPTPKPAEQAEPEKKESGLNFKFKSKTPNASSVKPGELVGSCKACYDGGLSCVCGNNSCCCSAPDGWCDPN